MRAFLAALCVAAAAAAADSRCAGKIPSSWSWVGPVVSRNSSSIQHSQFSVGAEGMDRQLTVFDNWKSYLSGTGAKFARVQAGWERCEPEGAGSYSWGWLDNIVVGMVARGVEPWIELSFGNSNYPNGGNAGSSSPFPQAGPALAGWLAWTTAVVCRYSPVDNIGAACAGHSRAPGLSTVLGANIFQVWDEPVKAGNTIQAYAALANATATAVSLAAPGAQVWVGGFSSPDAGLADALLTGMTHMGGVGLVTGVSYHSFTSAPEAASSAVSALRATASKYGDIEIVQGGGGAPSSPADAASQSGYNWTECSQAKWVSRRMVQDHQDDITTSVFTMVDMCTPDGGVVADGLIGATCPSKQVTKPKPAYYAFNALASLFDAHWHYRSLSITVTPASGGFGSYTPFTGAYVHDTSSEFWVALWLGGQTPTNAGETPTVDSTVTIRADGLFAPDLCWVDPVAGSRHRISTWSFGNGLYTITGVPLSDYVTVVVACPEAA
ncbi:hypothetical protein FNF29_05162 [Cafeteria roenbergensis]|uniref:Uncharacterized protein n=1 Tax=Cafeteria roenbergensis TaxID=33653 RepID=A0A5A8CDA2_CAFRO|nr:hypothetical protein FNF29_05162 [Cafeteria roenbergensis]|eukprot:KAA0150587.1 hypothetical protein FNF29_05162 [Cafeteria roenbergensis]